MRLAEYIKKLNNLRVSSVNHFIEPTTTGFENISESNCFYKPSDFEYL